MHPQSRRLAGAGITLLAIALVNGFLIDALPLSRLALSAHLVGLLGACFLLALSACWPGLTLSSRASRLGAFAAIYGFAGGWLVYFSAALTGAGGSFPMASGNTRGSPVVEGALNLGLLTVAIALFALCSIVLHGLRGVRQAS